jgi:c-di-GMP-binding flagellar brake protein YcgR
MGHELALGDRLEVVIGVFNCVSDVQEIARRGRLVISAPMYRSMTVPLTDEETVQVSYYRNGGKYSFVAKVAGRYRDGDLQLVELDVRSPVSKYQRREFVRMDTAIPLTVRLVALPEHIAQRTTDEILHMLCDRRYVGVPRPPLEGEELYSCCTVDLSGGGVSFAGQERFKPGALVECTFHLGEKGDVTADGQIVRVEQGSGRRPGWRVSAQFVNIEESIRRKFIKYIFDRQEALRQRDDVS